tara:strand:+ start:945 stop:1136 length:192 start_codon:yes stop_codon:yes gene_type:complete
MKIIKTNKNNFIEVEADIRKGDLYFATVHITVKDLEDVERFKKLFYEHKKVYLFGEEHEEETI